MLRSAQWPSHTTSAPIIWWINSSSCCFWIHIKWILSYHSSLKRFLQPTLEPAPVWCVGHRKPATLQALKIKTSAKNLLHQHLENEIKWSKVTIGPKKPTDTSHLISISCTQHLVFRNSCTSTSSLWDISNSIIPLHCANWDIKLCQKTIKDVFPCNKRCQSPDFIVFLSSDQVSGVLVNITNSNSSAPCVNPKANPKANHGQLWLGNSAWSCLSHLREAGQA